MYDERTALDDPVVLARVERTIGRLQTLCLVRIDEPQAEPLADVLHVRGGTAAERRRVDRWTCLHRSSGEIALEIGARSRAD